MGQKRVNKNSDTSRIILIRGYTVRPDGTILAIADNSEFELKMTLTRAYYKS